MVEVITIVVSRNERQFLLRREAIAWFQLAIQAPLHNLPDWQIDFPRDILQVVHGLNHQRHLIMLEGIIDGSCLWFRCTPHHVYRP